MRCVKRPVEVCAVLLNIKLSRTVSATVVTVWVFKRLEMVRMVKISGDPCVIHQETEWHAKLKNHDALLLQLVDFNMRQQVATRNYAVIIDQIELE